MTSNKKIRIKYLSYGINKTGGYRHELFLAKTLVNFFEKNNFNASLEILRKHRLYEGLFGYFKLLYFGFINANAHINIVVARLAISSILRNWFSKNKTIIVMHYFDKRDGKSLWLKMYYTCLFGLLRKSSHHRVAVVAVANFWQHYFVNQGIQNCFVYYNFFESKYYQKFFGSEKQKIIHLGQYSWKNDPKIFDLAQKLTANGFTCYFTTNDKTDEAYSTINYKVIFQSFDEYLNMMSKSMFTLALTKINEGWNRVAHESMLVGTPVIAYNSGGLAELVKGANGIIVNNIEEVFEVIIKAQKQQINYEFLNSFDAKNAVQFIEPLASWVLKNKN